jgi:hypothetical protein
VQYEDMLLLMLPGLLFHHLDGASAAEFVGMFRYITTEPEDSSSVFVRTVALPS